MDPQQGRGLWWCKDADDVFAASINAVAKPPNMPWDKLKEISSEIKEYKYILVCLPLCHEREEIVNELLLRFNMPVYVPADEVWRGCTSVKELNEKGGIKAVEALLHRSREIPMPGLLDVSDIPEEEPLKKNRTFSGLRPLDKAIGGFSPGEMSVWTGKRGEGKSTLISQLIPEAVAIGRQVCVYSGEMPAIAFRSILYQQIAGRRNIFKTVDEATGKEIFKVKEDAKKEISKWIKGNAFITDIKQATAHDEDNILSLFEYAYLRYRCSVFIVDNIMTTALKEEVRLGQWRAQSLFATRLTAFAKRFDVHVHLVAHPRKTKDQNFDSDDVAGSSDVTNKADNVFRVGRVPDEKVAEAGHSAGIQILKNRRYGERWKIELNFDPVCRRFYPVGGSSFRQFDWEVG